MAKKGKKNTKVAGEVAEIETVIVDVVGNDVIESELADMVDNEDGGQVNGGDVEVTSEHDAVTPPAEPEVESEEPEEEGSILVDMVRHDGLEADVHPDMVDYYSRHGYRLA